MILNAYHSLIRVLLILAGIAIAITIIYMVLADGGTPLMDAQMGGYDAVINQTTSDAIAIISGSNVFNV
jgi:hypothetical protein